MPSLICFKPIDFPPIISDRSDVKTFQNTYRLLQITSIALTALAISVSAASFIYTIPFTAMLLLTIGAFLLFEDVKNMSDKLELAIEKWIDKNQDQHRDWISTFGDVTENTDLSDFLSSQYFSTEIRPTLVADSGKDALGFYLFHKFTQDFSSKARDLCKTYHIDSEETALKMMRMKTYKKDIQKAIQTINEDLEGLYQNGKAPNANTSTKDAINVKSSIKKARTLFILRHAFTSSTRGKVQTLRQKMLGKFSFSAVKPALFEGNWLLYPWMVP